MRPSSERPGGSAVIPCGADSERAGADELNELDDFGELTEVSLDQLEGARLCPAFFVENSEGLTDRVDRFVRHSRPPEADQVKTRDAVISLRQDERRQILR